MYYLWTIYGMIICFSWIYDCLCVVHTKSVDKSKENMKRMFDCDDMGDIEVYLG